MQYAAFYAASYAVLCMQCCVMCNGVMVKLPNSISTITLLLSLFSNFLPVFDNFKPNICREIRLLLNVLEFFGSLIFPILWSCTYNHCRPDLNNTTCTAFLVDR